MTHKETVRVRWTHYEITVFGEHLKSAVLFLLFFLIFLFIYLFMHLFFKLDEALIKVKFTWHLHFEIILITFYLKQFIFTTKSLKNILSESNHSKKERDRATNDAYDLKLRDIFADEITFFRTLRASSIFIFFNDHRI